MVIVCGNLFQVVVSRLLVYQNLAEQGAFCLLDLSCVLPVLQQVLHRISEFFLRALIAHLDFPRGSNGR